MNESLGAIESLEARLGYQFRDRERLRGALTHASVVDSALPRVFERLEFLGDAVVGLVVSELLLSRYPAHDEGQLSKFRAALVNAGSLAGKARELGFDEHLTLGRGEEKTGGRFKVSILAAAFEAVLGAIFLDGGYVAARDVVKAHFADAVDAIGVADSTDAKTELQELCQQRHRTTPRYRVVEELGPDHARHFVVEVVLGESVLARGEGRSKRRAEQQAARCALDVVRVAVSAAKEQEGRARPTES